jgi:hypothetical protein
VTKSITVERQRRIKVRNRKAMAIDFSEECSHLKQPLPQDVVSAKHGDCSGNPRHLEVKSRTRLPEPNEPTEKTGQSLALFQQLISLISVGKWLQGKYRYVTLYLLNHTRHCENGRPGQQQDNRLC